MVVGEQGEEQFLGHGAELDRQGGEVDAKDVLVALVKNRGEIPLVVAETGRGFQDVAGDQGLVGEHEGVVGDARKQGAGS